MGEIIRRTFEASKHPAGSAERIELNKDARTSEYQTSYRYLLRRPFLMSDGSPHPTQRYIDRAFRTKSEAQINAVETAVQS